MRAYAQELRKRVRNGEFAASTANTYYATVRACLSWAVEDGLIDTNPAAATRATKELPENTTEPDRQFWTPEDVQALFAHLSQRIDEASMAGNGRSSDSHPEPGVGLAIGIDWCAGRRNLS
ncbi:hypothetical protein [Natrinema sp. CBA1119]|uniref:hypothetical protein n=1 Tax=Natrinema sp. CBA1119 TaxID=1608465 RepID=UPI00374217CA